MSDNHDNSTLISRRDRFSGNGTGNQNDLSSKMMLTAIISLSVVVVLVIILHLYARYVLRQQARRRAALRQLGLAISAAEQPKTGLDPSVIASLPVFVFRRTDINEERECAVCLSALENDEMARLLPNCNHTFHVECIDKWLDSQATCPICRTEAKPRLVPEPREPPFRGGGGGGAPPTAPPLERGNFTEGTSEGGEVQISAKVTSGSSLRLSSFRRMLSRERSSPRVQSHGGEHDLERL